MPLPPYPPPGYDWMPFAQRLLRALPFHPAVSGLTALALSHVAFSALLLAVQPGSPGAAWDGFVAGLAGGFWIDYLVMLLVAYVFVAADMLRRHMERSLDRLRPQLALDAAAFAAARKHVFAYSRWTRNVVGAIAVVAVISAGGGLNSVAPFYADTPGEHVLTGLIWVRVAILLWGSATLMHDELLAMWRLSHLVRRHLRVDLFNDTLLAPLGHVGLVATLFMAVGVSLATPLLSDRVWTFATGVYLALLTVGAVALLVMPALGARDAISGAKDSELDRLDDMIATHPGRQGADVDSAAALGSLVVLRTAVEDAREWPFGRPTLVRWLLLVSIPVGSWFAGALVERLVDSALG